MPEKINPIGKFKAIIFDMDGVLVDVSQSYRVAIKKTAEFFLGKMIDNEQIERLKLAGGYNDDYDCAEALLRNNGRFVPREIVIKKFQEYYLGKAYGGLIDNEKWIMEKALLNSLVKKYKLGIFTGRPRFEANYALKNSTAMKYFMSVISMEDTPNKKPAPDGLILAMNKIRTKSAVYVGDSIDDLHAARAANIEFIGVIAPGCDRARCRAVLKDNGAKVILENVNQIVKVVK